MTTLRKTMVLTIAITMVVLSIGSDTEAGRRGHSSFRRGGSSMSRGMSRTRGFSRMGSSRTRNVTRNTTRINSSRMSTSRTKPSSRMQSFGKQNTRMKPTRNNSRFGKMNTGRKLNTGTRFNSKKPTSRNLGRNQTRRIGTNSNRNGSRSQKMIRSGKHKGKFKWHFGIYRPYRHYRRNYYIPCTTGFGFNYSCQQPVYSNPYCSPVVVGSPAPIYDDSIQIAGQEGMITETETGKDNFEKAREAFYKGDLKTALPLIEQASKEMPGNPNVQQFRSLVLFAMKDYDNAAAAAYTALTIGPGWDWKTLNSLFPSTEIYTSLLRALEADMAKDEKITSKKFLLAYHYLMLGEKEAAGKQLTVVVQAEPRNDVAKQLLKMIGGITPQVDEIAVPPAPAE